MTVVGVFDLGFGRAMTQAVAARIGRDDDEPEPSSAARSVALEGIKGTEWWTPSSA